MPDFLPDFARLPDYFAGLKSIEDLVLLINKRKYIKHVADVYTTTCSLHTYTTPSKKSMGDYITGTCPNCYGTKLVENLDELSCATCGHRIEDHLSLNVVENDIFSGFRQASQSQSQLRRRKEFLQSQEGIDADGGIMNNNNKVKEFLSKKRRRKEELKKTDVHYFNYLEAMYNYTSTTNRSFNIKMWCDEKYQKHGL